MDVELGDWTEPGSALRTALEQRLLPGWMPSRRWFQGKSRSLASVTLIDGLVLSREGGRHDLLAWVATDDGAGRAVYQVPLVLDAAPAGGPGPARGDLLGSTEIAGQTCFLSEALADPVVPRLLLEQIATQGQLTTQRGRLTAQASPALHDFIAQRPTGPGRLSQAEQSHSNIIFGDRLLLKVFRKLDAGQNPDIEIGKILTEHTSFRGMPRLFGSLAYRTANNCYSAGMLQEFIPSRGQGWEWMLGLLGSGYTAAMTSNPPSPLEAVERQLAHEGSILGEQTAELHRALAGLADMPDFAPEPFTAADWDERDRALLEQVERTQRSLQRTSDLAPDVRESAASVLAAIPAWLQNQTSFQTEGGAAGSTGRKIRIHGDYHLGQTLRAADSYVILDFEGEPSRPIAERRAKQTPLRDLAGMLRSFDYAVHAALDRADTTPSPHARPLAIAASRFRETLTRSFTDAYQSRVKGSEWFPTGPAARALLDRLLIEKAVYELDYEMNNRPTWAGLPLRGLIDLVRADGSVN